MLMRKETSKDPNNTRGRRGRPPKFPRNEIPVIPKMVEMDEATTQMCRNLHRSMQGLLHGRVKYTTCYIAERFDKSNQARTPPQSTRFR